MKSKFLEKTAVRLFIVSLSLLTLPACNGNFTHDRREVKEIDYRILAQVFHVKNPKSAFVISNVFFQKGGLGAPGELVYKMSSSSDTLNRVLSDVHARPLEHGPLTKVYPFEVHFFGDNTQDLKDAFQWSSTLRTDDGPTTTNTYIFIDPSTSPTLNIFMKTDPRYAIFKL